MNRVQHSFLLFALLIIGYASYAQSGVGIGISTPNPNAILDIVSSTNDKGILIPRLNTAQRTAMNAALSTNENGLMVFDSDLNGFYFWNGSSWMSITVIQDLQLVGNTLSITNNGSATNIDLAPFSGSNTDNQTLSLAGTNLSITGGNTLNLASIQDGVDDADNDPTNEIELPATASTNDVLVWSGSSWVAGTDQTTDADASTTNELITGGTLSGTTLRITDAGGNTDVNLVSLQDGFEANTDNQNLGVNISGTNRTVTITGGTNTTFSVADNDNSTTNEIELPATAGTNDVLVWNGSSWVAGTDQTVDGDANSTNEIQNLTSVLSQGNSAGNSKITNLANPTLTQDAATKSYVDAQDHSDNQTLLVSGSTLTIAGGNSVILPTTTTKEAFKVYLGNSVTVPANNTEGVNFNSTAYDLNGNYAGGKYLAPVDGIYSLSGVFDMQMEEASNFTIFITVDDVPRYSMKERTLSLGTGTFIGFGFSTDLQLSAGEVVQFVLFSSNSQLLNGGTEYGSYIAGRLVVEF